MPVIFTIFVLTTKSLRLMADDSQEIFSGYKQSTDHLSQSLVCWTDDLPRQPYSVMRAYKREFNSQTAPGRKTLLRWLAQFRTLWDLQNQDRAARDGTTHSGRPTIRTEEVVATVSDSVKWAQNAVFTPLTLSAIWRSLRSFGMLYQFRKEGLDGFSKMGLHFIAQ